MSVCQNLLDKTGSIYKSDWKNIDDKEKKFNGLITLIHVYKTKNKKQITEQKR